MQICPKESGPIPPQFQQPLCSPEPVGISATCIRIKLSYADEDIQFYTLI